MSVEFDSVSYRDGAHAGAAEAVECLRQIMLPCDVVALEGWLTELADWSGGPMPVPPYKWDDSRL